jgi:hypothetical protein
MMEQEFFQQQILNFSQIAMPWITIIFGFIVFFALKDMGTKIAKSISFKVTPAFMPGDQVVLDNEPAIIVKIGLLSTVFGVYKPNGTYCWRYVSNERNPYTCRGCMVSEMVEANVCIRISGDLSFRFSIYANHF